MIKAPQEVVNFELLQLKGDSNATEIRKSGAVSGHNSYGFRDNGGS
jgi:hypothetical protein